MKPGISSDFRASIAAWRAIPADALRRRFALVALAGFGSVVTMMRSLVYEVSPAIPWKIFPDARPVALFAFIGLLGLWACAGGRSRRVVLLYAVLAVVIGFHLEEASVHWFAEFTGSITGTRVDLIGTAGSLGAVAAVLLLQADCESQRVAEELVARGAAKEEAHAARRGLVRGAAKRVGAIAAAGAGLALLVLVMERLASDTYIGGTYFALGAGVALLAAGAFFALKAARGRVA